MTWYESLKDSGGHLSGTHFVANISHPEQTGSGIILTNRDPRKQYRKPDAYAGKVLEISENCELVKVGDSVVFERWDWNQFEVDGERIIAREKELIIINEEPVSGYIIFKLEEDEIKTSIFIPHTYEKPRPKILHGRVLASGVKGIEVGEGYYFEAMDSYQYHYGDGRMAFRVNRGANLLLRYEPKVADLKEIKSDIPSVVVPVETATTAS